MLIIVLTRKSAEVEKWMDVPTAIDAFVPEAKTNYVESTKEVERLQEELQMAQKASAIAVDILKKYSPYDQTYINYLQYKLSIAKNRSTSVF